MDATPPQLVMRRPDLAGLPPLAIPDGLELRRATGADAEDLAGLLRAAFAVEWDAAGVHAQLLSAADVRATFLLREAGAVVATASAALRPLEHPDAGYVHWVAADPRRSGRGLGRLVSLAVMHEFIRLGQSAAVLTTDDHRLPAIRTYLGLGFQPCDRHPSHAERWRRILAGLA